MPKLHNPDLWQQSSPRPYRTITGDGEGGSSDTAPKDPPQQEPNGEHNGDGADASKEFSHALAKRVAEIEKKYEAKLKDYEQLKEKAAAYDEQQESGKSDMDKLNERIAAIEAERDKLAAEKQRHELVSRVAKETGMACGRARHALRGRRGGAESGGRDAQGAVRQDGTQGSSTGGAYRRAYAQGRPPRHGPAARRLQQLTDERRPSWPSH